MKKRINMLSGEEMLDYVNRQWATITDIMKIGCMGYKRAKIVQQEIIDNFLEEHPNRILPYKLVRMQDVLDYFDIKISFLKKVANK